MTPDDRTVSDVPYEGPGNPHPAGPSRWTPRRIFGIVVAVSVVAIWGYVMFLTVFEGRDEPRERLGDESYRAAAESVCAPYRDRIDDLPMAIEADNPAERADLLDTATDELDEMVDDLEELSPPQPDEEAEAVERWLADWDEYIQNRRDYAERFRAGIDEPFRVTARGGEQIDTKMDEFAHINFMESCETPDDVG